MMFYGQTMTVSSFLESIEANNTYLKSLKATVERKKAAMYTNNSLPNLEVGGYYMPFSQHSTGDYTEFEITQSFQLPGTYRFKTQYADQNQALFDIEYHIERQSMLLKASNLLSQYHYYKKVLELENKRFSQTKLLETKFKSALTNGEITILEYNRVKLHSLQQSYLVENTKSKIKEIQASITLLNGGQEISLDLVSNFSLERDKRFNGYFISTEWISKEYSGNSNILF